ncbi:MAG: bifunctional hydroxymethylpyrimidine kinase/phosphomethylpyrimidine kinase [Magnetococcales bacterium]|nr:bifunctional hydroxymethylpyrimidine kinase/phosphomethylpyrimidine kinase [Magnetococcales bacterium]MBF0322329.1 bifunctional hydroxymethylpyrimidine kinase/phosphomethylpyrimidine kinase [Magnetococcales bacterium]
MTSTTMNALHGGRVLIVAGSDPVGGAGLQADLKTVTALGGHAMTAVTAITVQDTRQLYTFFPLDPAWVVQQMRVVLQDVGVDCIKLGMLGSPGIVAAVAEVLRDIPDVPVVADPVLAAGGGGSLLQDGGMEILVRALLPRVTLLTPNIPEAEALTGMVITSPATMEQAAQKLAGGGGSILLTGGHQPGEIIHDLLVAGQESHWFTSPRRPGPGFHGTGCTLASAVATGLAQGMPMLEAVARGIAFVHRAVAESYALGHGQLLLRHHSFQSF